MAKPHIDPQKLRVQLRGLRKDALLDLLDRAIDLMPKTRLAALTQGHFDPRLLAPDRKAAGGLLEIVRTFQKASLRGDYYEDFMVDSKNYMLQSRGTKTLIAECERLFDRCVAEASAGRHAELRDAFEILFGLLRYIDEGHDDLVFFADEGGSWQIGVPWNKVLPAYFTCLSATSNPAEYAKRVNSTVEAFASYDRDKYFRSARRVGTAAQKKRLR